MVDRLSRIVTRTGDDGGTSLGDGTRTAKTSARIHAIGEIDELNCWLGVVIEQALSEDIERLLATVQHVLFDIGGELSLPGHTMIDAGDVEAIEQSIASYNGELPPLKEFILPGGTEAAAFCHLARAVCRRVERHLVALMEQEPQVNRHSLIYVNRLSDLLFIIARTLVRRQGGDEVYWQKDRRR